MTVGKMVYERRLRLKLTQEEVARQVGITRAWLSQIENDLIKSPGWGPVSRLERVLQFNRGELLQGFGYSATEEEEKPTTVRDVLEAIRRNFELLDELEKRERGESDENSGRRRVGRPRRRDSDNGDAAGVRAPTPIWEPDYASA